jgi:hypothetical protein
MLRRLYLKKRIAELEQSNAALDKYNMELKMDLDRSNDMIKTLESRNASLNADNVNLRKSVEDLESKAKAWDEEKVNIEKSLGEKIAAIEDRYKAYRVKVKKNLMALHGSYEIALNGICAQCLPNDAKSSSWDEFIKWFESEVTSLPEVFVGTNDNFAAIALEGVLNMLKSKSCDHLDNLHTIAAS